MALAGGYPYEHYSPGAIFEEVSAILFTKRSIGLKEVFPAEYDDVQRCLVCQEVKDFKNYGVHDMGYICSDGCLLNTWYFVVKTLKKRDKGSCKLYWFCIIV